MARVKRGVTAHARHKKVLKQAKGYYGRRKNTIRIAKQAVEKGHQYAYRDRRNKKRTFGRCGSSASTPRRAISGCTYAAMIDGLAKAGVEVDRKVLSDLASHEPCGFRGARGPGKSGAGLSSAARRRFEHAVRSSGRPFSFVVMPGLTRASFLTAGPRRAFGLIAGSVRQTTAAQHVQDVPLTPSWATSLLEQDISAAIAAARRPALSRSASRARQEGLVSERLKGSADVAEEARPPGRALNGLKDRVQL
jgi:large subunit ribosomal protein L20